MNQQREPAASIMMSSHHHHYSNSMEETRNAETSSCSASWLTPIFQEALSNRFQPTLDLTVSSRIHNHGHTHSVFSSWDAATAHDIVTFLKHPKARHILHLKLDSLIWGFQESACALKILATYLRESTQIRSIQWVGTRNDTGSSITTKNAPAASCSFPHKQARQTIRDFFHAMYHNNNNETNKKPWNTDRVMHFFQVDFGREPLLQTMCQELLQQEGAKRLHFSSCQFREDIGFLTEQPQRARLQDLQLFDCRDLSDASASRLLQALLIPNSNASNASTTTSGVALKRLSLSWNPHLHSQTFKILLRQVLPRCHDLHTLQLEHNARLFVAAGARTRANTAAIDSPTQEFRHALCYQNASILHLQVNHNHAREVRASVGPTSSHTPKQEATARNPQLATLDTSPEFQIQLAQCRKRNRWNRRVQTLLQAPSKANEGAVSARMEISQREQQQPPNSSSSQGGVSLALWGTVLGTLALPSTTTFKTGRGTMERDDVPFCTISAMHTAVSALSPDLVARNSRSG